MLTIFKHSTPSSFLSQTHIFPYFSKCSSQIKSLSSSTTLWNATRTPLEDVKRLPSWVPKKKKKLLEDYYRKQWHQRITAPKLSQAPLPNKNSSPTQPALSKNQQFKQIDINTDTFRFIKENDLGKVRVSKVLRLRRERGQRDLDTREVTPSENVSKTRRLY
jgi:hypothetical protein